MSLPTILELECRGLTPEKNAPLTNYASPGTPWYANTLPLSFPPSRSASDRTPGNFACNLPRCILDATSSSSAFLASGLTRGSGILYAVEPRSVRVNLGHWNFDSCMETSIVATLNIATWNIAISFVATSNIVTSFVAEASIFVHIFGSLSSSNRSCVFSQFSTLPCSPSLALTSDTSRPVDFLFLHSTPSRRCSPPRVLPLRRTEFRNTICSVRGIDWQVGCKGSRGRSRGRTGSHGG